MFEKRSSCLIYLYIGSVINIVMCEMMWYVMHLCVYLKCIINVINVILWL